MFNPKDNEVFYPMGLEVASAVMEAIEQARDLDPKKEEEVEDMQM